MRIVQVFTFVFAIIIALPSLAQDLIYKNNGEVIECEVVSIDPKFVIYTKTKYTGNKEFSIKKSLVKKIVYESAKSDSTLGASPIQQVNLEEKLQKQNKNIFKLGVFSPLAGALSIGYERSVRPSRAYDVAIGLIGVGTEINENAVGAYGRIGYKFYRNPEFYQSHGDNAHLLHGFYLMPTIMVSYYTYDSWPYGSYYYNGNNNGNKITTEAYSVALILNFGKQWVINDEFSIGFYFGAGYAISSEGGYYYSHATFGNEFPLALNCGVNMGFLN